MDRRKFVKKVCQAGAGGMLLLAGTSGIKAESQEQPVPPPEDKEKKFSQEWIVNVVASMDSKLGEKEKIRILEACGRACARKSSIQTALENRGDLEKFLAAMRGLIGEGNVQREGKRVQLAWNQCYCPNVRALDKVPPLYCNCSRGWVKEMFETALGKPVDVKLLTSIKRGDKECRLVVNV
jgi:predicted hydrocarbon binding protein